MKKQNIFNRGLYSQVSLCRGGNNSHIFLFIHVVFIDRFCYVEMINIAKFCYTEVVFIAVYMFLYILGGFHIHMVFTGRF